MGLVIMALASADVQLPGVKSAGHQSGKTQLLWVSSSALCGRGYVVSPFEWIQ